MVFDQLRRRQACSFRWALVSARLREPFDPCSEYLTISTHIHINARPFHPNPPLHVERPQPEGQGRSTGAPVGRCLLSVCTIALFATSVNGSGYLPVNLVMSTIWGWVLVRQVAAGRP